VYVAPGVAPYHSSDEPQHSSVLSGVQHLLGQRYVTANPNVLLDGARAIEFTFVRGRFSYWVSPRTYQPLQVEDRCFRCAVV
jgi:hypothetical protein